MKKKINNVGSIQVTPYLTHLKGICQHAKPNQTLLLFWHQTTVALKLLPSTLQHDDGEEMMNDDVHSISEPEKLQ